MPLFFLLFWQIIFQPPGVGGWKTYTSYNSIADVVYAHERIWVASEGGIFYFNPGSNEITTVTNADGLARNEVAALDVDASGRIWAGLKDGVMNRASGPGESWQTITADPEPFVLHDLAISEDRIFLGTGFGISEYIISKNEIRASFRTLGQFARNTPVNRVWIDGETIWAGTDLGIASANINASNLQDPQFWTNFTTAQGLSSNNINGFINYNGDIFAATGAGVVRLSGRQWIVDGLSGIDVRDLQTDGSRMYAGAEQNVYKREQSGLWSQIGPGRQGVQRIFLDPEGGLWAGTENDGFSFYNQSQNDWDTVAPNAPAGNTFSSMAFDANNVLWAASGNSGEKGLYSYDGENWRNFGRTDGFPSDNITSVAVDAQGRVWCGTPGDGAFLFTSSIGGGIETIRVFDERNGRLTGSDTPSFVIVDDIAVDGNGVVWLLNRFANNGRAVVAVEIESSIEASQWNYFSTSDGLVSNQVSALAFDDQGRVWIGTSGGSGLSVLDYGGTLADKSDDNWTTFRTLDGLADNVVNFLAKDKLGYIWIATPQGINYWDGTILRRLFGLIDSFVQAILVDPSNNKWFGTSGGVSMVDRDNFRWAHYTTGNSPIVDERVLSLSMNEGNGDLFIGTANGVSFVQTPFNEGVETGEGLVGYPNPFIIQGNGRLVIGALQANSTVKIFTSSGRLIRELSEEEGSVAGAKAFWNGMDGENRPVASGIYIIVAESLEGDLRKGKIAVLRP